MAHLTADRVKETTTTTGTGAITLAGAIVGFRAFSSVLSIGDTCYYSIASLPGAEWEVGIGTYSALNTLTRTTVLSSSNAGAAVTFSAGTKEIFITAAASRFLQADNTNTVFTSSQLSISGTGYAVALGNDSGGSISIGRKDNVASSPYIDFNSGATTVDYDVRLTASGGTGVAGNGTLFLTGNFNPTTTTTYSLGSSSLVWAANYANKFISSNTSSQSLTDGAAIFNGAAGAIVIDDAGHKRISWNDGGGNFNIRAGNYYNGTSAAVIYTKGSGDTNSGAATITFNSDSTDGVISMSVAAIGVPGAAVAYSKTLTLATTGMSYDGNITATTFIGALTGNASGSAATFTSTTQNSQFNSIGVGVAASTTAGRIDAGNIISSGYVSAVGGSGQLQAVSGSASTWYNAFLRNDASNVYLMSSAVQTTQALATNATWNAYRPFSWSLTTGAVTIDGTGIGATFGGTITGTRLISNIATGTAPLAVTSTTLVTNLNADLLDGLNSTTANTASTIVARDSSGGFSAGTITAVGGIKSSDTVQPSYQILLDFGADTLGTWRKIITATLSPGTQYSTHGFRIRITDPNANHATQGSVNVDEVVYYVACVRSEGTVIDTPDLCVVRGPASHVRAVKLATGSYEIQVQPEAQYREYLITIESYATNGAHTIVYSNGSTAGSAGTATYSAAVGGATTWVDKLQSTGTITGTQLVSNIATGTAPLAVTSTTLVTNLNADLLDGLNSATANTASTIVARDANGAFSAGVISMASTSQVRAQGTEGGEIVLEKGTAQTNLGGNIHIDTLGDVVRVYENGGTFRQFNFNLTNGNISATNGSITANLTGNASTATSVGSLTGIATVAPLAAGTAAVGTSTLGARQDHVHPLQTTISGNAATATSATNLYGTAGNYIASTGPASTSYANSIQVREIGLGGAQASAMAAAPRLSFHWSGLVASSIAMEASGRIGIFNNAGTGYEALVCAGLQTTSIDNNGIYYARSNYSVLNTAQTGWNTAIDRNGGDSWIVYGGNSVRAPIFYDSNDTAYYTDPASTSNLNSLNIVDGNIELYKSQTIDMSNTGVYSTSNYYPVTIGVPLAGVWIEIQNNLNSNVPSWSTHPSGFTLNLRWRTNGSGWGTTAIKRRVEQYYELFTNSTICGGISQLGQSSTEVVWLRGGGTYYFRFSRNVTATAQTANYTINSQTAAVTATAINTVWNSGVGAHVSYDDSVFAATRIDSPIFYDANNTAYYLDPSSTTALRTVGSWRADSSAWDGEFSGKIQYHANHWYIQAADSLIYRNAASSNVFTVNQDGVAISSNSFRAPIFYDSNDTAYYIDPNSTANNALKVRGGAIFGPNTSWAASLYIGTNGNPDINTATVAATNGNLHLDAANGYVMYLNNYASSSYTIAAQSMRSPIFYDSDDTGYYCNPNSTSRLNEAHTDRTYGFTDIRSPIYYDYNDTGYYVDPNGTSVLNRISTVRANNWLYLDANYGHSVVGAYDSTRLQGVFAMGDSYKLAADGLSTSNMYGLAWSHPNAGTLGGANNLNDHGLLLINNGGFRAAISSRAVFSADVRGTLFYDYNDTGYYCDPNSGSYLNSLVLSGSAYFRPNTWIQFDSSYGIYWPNHYGAHLYANTASTYTQIRIDGSKGGYGGIYDSSSGVNIGMYDSGGNGGLYREANGRWYQYHSVANDCTGFGTSTTGSAYNIYAPKGIYSGGRVDGTIFYDANDTGYYVDPNGSSQYGGLQYFISNRNTTSDSPALQAYSNNGSGAIMSFHRGGYYAVNFGLDSDNVIRIGGWSAAANRWQLDMSGNGTYAGNVTAYSDERLKKDWTDLDFDFVKRLASVKSGTYTRTDEDIRQVGVSAQSLQLLLPEAVLTQADGMLSVAYGNAALASAVELAKDNVDLRRKAERLESIIDAQEERINRLEKLVERLTS